MPASWTASAATRQVSQAPRCSASQARSSGSSSWRSWRIAISGRARSQSGDEAATDANAVPRSSSRRLILAREMSWATELRFMSISPAISS